MPRKKIVILDAFATNPGDLNWNKLAAMGDLTVYEHCDPNDQKEILRRCADAEIVVPNKVPFTAERLAALPKLEMLALQSTGYNIVDLQAANDHGVVVCNVPGYSTDSVAQMTLALMLELYIGVKQHDEAVKAGEWCRSIDFTFYPRPTMELAGKTLGIFGFGAIGQKVGRLGADLGMRVLYYTRTPKVADFATPVTDREQLFRESDILTLHAPLTQETKGMINRHTLALMKPTAYLINTARGALVDETALAEALISGRLAGAGLDVMVNEPPLPDNPLLKIPNCIITPHVAWGTFEARKRLIDIIASNIAAFLDGHPVNQVN